MKNLNEPRRNAPENPSEAQVVSLEDHRARMGGEASLIPKREMEDLQSRWTAIQAAFVDNPRHAVEEANALVSSALKEIEESFRDQHSQIQKQWSEGADASTEDLRIALQQYRMFFDRLLSL